MVQFALPLWLVVVLSLGLVVLFVAASFGLSVFLSQLVRGQMEFEGALPVNDLQDVPPDSPRYNPRLREVDPTLAAELLQQAEDDRRRPPRVT